MNVQRVVETELCPLEELRVVVRRLCVNHKRGSNELGEAAEKRERHT